jgi:hypothetical protein
VDIILHSVVFLLQICENLRNLRIKNLQKILIQVSSLLLPDVPGPGDVLDSGTGLPRYVVNRAPE